MLRLCLGLVSTALVGICTWAGAFLLAATAPALAADLTVRVTGLRSAAGEVRVALYAGREGFATRDGMTDERVVPIGREGAVAVFSALAPGRFALAAFHDENGNRRFDRNLLGIPVEGYAFSNGARGFLSAPAFEAAAIAVGDGGAEITIEMGY